VVSIRRGVRVTSFFAKGEEEKVTSHEGLGGRLSNEGKQTFWAGNQEYDLNKILHNPEIPSSSWGGSFVEGAEGGIPGSSLQVVLLFFESKCCSVSSKLLPGQWRSCSYAKVCMDTLGRVT